jgi:hypothetical protein
MTRGAVASYARPSDGISGAADADSDATSRVTALYQAQAAGLVRLAIVMQLRTAGDHDHVQFEAFCRTGGCAKRGMTR